MVEINVLGVIFGTKLALTPDAAAAQRAHHQHRLAGRRELRPGRRDLLRHQARREGLAPSRPAASTAAPACTSRRCSRPSPTPSWSPARRRHQGHPQRRAGRGRRRRRAAHRPPAPGRAGHPARRRARRHVAGVPAARRVRVPRPRASAPRSRFVAVDSGVRQRLRGAHPLRTDAVTWRRAGTVPPIRRVRRVRACAATSAASRSRCAGGAAGRREGHGDARHRVPGVVEHGRGHRGPAGAHLAVLVRVAAPADRRPAGVRSADGDRGPDRRCAARTRPRPGTARGSAPPAAPPASRGRSR